MMWLDELFTCVVTRFYSIYAPALLPNLGPGNCVIVPQAPVEVLEQLGELLHTAHVLVQV